jgi:micrococcal nuclease
MSRATAAAWITAFAALVVLANFLLEDSPAPSDQSSPAPATEREATVLRVVDGDTILVRGSEGRSERVRYIGVDTPESVKPDSPVECFGREASDYNKQLVQGRKVRLVADREAEDRFGRSLAFVYVGDTFVNAQMIRGGYARTIEIEPNTSKAEFFADLERVAIRTRKGLWRACDR